MKSTFCTFALVLLISVMPVSGKTRVLTPEQFGLKAGTGENASPVLKKMIESITNDNQNDKTVIRFSADMIFMKTVLFPANTIYPITTKTTPNG